MAAGLIRRCLAISQTIIAWSPPFNILVIGFVGSGIPAERIQVDRLSRYRPRQRLSVARRGHAAIGNWRELPSPCLFAYASSLGHWVMERAEYRSFLPEVMETLGTSWQAFERPTTLR